MGLYRHTVTTASYSRLLSTLGSMSKDHIFKALKHCIMQHHALCTIVCDADTEAPRLTQALRVDLEDHLHIMDAADDDCSGTVESSLLITAHNQELPAGHPPWRVLLLPIRSETTEKIIIAFVCSHAFMDGRSAFIFHETFVEALRNLDSSTFDSEPAFETSSHYNVVPALDDGGKLSISRALLQATIKGPGGDILSHDPVWTGSSCRPDVSASKNPPISLEIVTIPSTVMQNAVAACRCHDARLTGLLSHLSARAIIKALRNRGQGYSKLLSFTPFDLRKLLDEEQNTMANLVSSVTETIEPSAVAVGEDHGLDDEDWAKIRVTTGLLRERSMAFVDQPTRLLGYLPSVQQYLHGLATAPLTESFCMSNLGSLDGSTNVKGSNAWTIDDVIFSQSSFAGGAVLLFNVASTKGGVLNITVTWWPGVIGVGDDNDEREFVREICRDIVLRLEGVGH